MAPREDNESNITKFLSDHSRVASRVSDRTAPPSVCRSLNVPRKECRDFRQISQNALLRIIVGKMGQPGGRQTVRGRYSPFGQRRHKAPQEQDATHAAEGGTIIVHSCSGGVNTCVTLAVSEGLENDIM